MALDDDKINKIINKKINTENALDRPTFKQLSADKVASFGGSWSFIFLFTVFFMGWIAVNTLLGKHAFDYPPFIMLNLILSTLAVFQAPFILMSQNRMSEIDRKREERAYKISIRTEIEIKELHNKIEKLCKIIEKDNL